MVCNLEILVILQVKWSTKNELGGSTFSCGTFEDIGTIGF